MFSILRECNGTSPRRAECDGGELGNSGISMNIKVMRVIFFTRQIDRMSEYDRDVLGLKQVTNEKSWREFDAGGLRIALHSGPPSPGKKGPKIALLCQRRRRDPR